MLDAQIDWQSLAIQEAVLALYKYQQIKRMSANAVLVDELLTSNWLLPSEQEDIFNLSARGKSGLVELMDRHLPEWREWLKLLEGDAGLVSEVFDKRWGYVQKALRSDLPRVMNKSSLQRALLGREMQEFPEHLQEQLPKITLSEDRCLHLRGRMDLKLVKRHGATIELQKLWRQLSEAIIPERDFHQIKELDGELPYLVMTFEDRGVFLDIDLPENLLAVWVPPEHLELAGEFLRFLPQFVPHVHFGDLDHQGLVVAERLGRMSQRPVRRFIPGFWAEYLDAFSQKVEPATEGKGSRWRGPLLSVSLLRELMTSHRWLEQAPLSLDARLHDEMRKLMD